MHSTTGQCIHDCHLVTAPNIESPVQLCNTDYAFSGTMIISFGAISGRIHSHLCKKEPSGYTIYLASGYSGLVVEKPLSIYDTNSMFIFQVGKIITRH